MFKCSNCKDKNANFYQRINKENELFVLLPKSISNREHIYLCDKCLRILEAKKKENSLAEASDQNANCLSANQTSFTSTTTNSSKDEYDMMVPSQISISDTGSIQFHKQPQSRVELHKRRVLANVQDKVKPCPKRFKKYYSQREEDVLNVSNIGRNEEVVTTASSQNLNIIESESGLLLMLDSDSNETTVASIGDKGQTTTPQATIVRPITGRRRIEYNNETSGHQRHVNLGILHKTGDDSPPVFNLQQNWQQQQQQSLSPAQLQQPNSMDEVNAIRQVEATSIPAISTIAPAQTITRERSQITTRNIREYFETRGGSLNINNYSRTTAG